jgi:hypothetical protein
VTGRGDETTPPTLTHGSVPDYVASYRKGCMRTPNRQNRKIGMSGAYTTTKKGYTLRKI